MLIDTIIKNIPMPKIFLSAELKNGSTYRIVIDGQQRISAILEFIGGQFALDDPYDGPYSGKRFSELPSGIQTHILQYKIDFSEISNADDSELREIFHRVNKYTVALNSQELRIADFPGDFQSAAKLLSNHPFFSQYNIFTAAHTRRSLDIEYVSELLIVIVSGVTNKKEELDRYYKDLRVWDEAARKMAIEQFKGTLHEIELLNNEKFELGRSRFKQKADFYSLFAAVAEYKKLNFTLQGKDTQALIDDLVFLDENIAPGSSITDLKNYAVKCVSQANTASSREWRKKFLQLFLNGTVGWYDTTVSEANMLARILVENDAITSLYCQSGLSCAFCGSDMNFDDQDFNIFWNSGIPNQLTNAKLCHALCDLPDSAKRFSVHLKSSVLDELAVDSDQKYLDF
jgi:hypothetical protein